MPASKQTIQERQSNLPLPEQPPVASDWNSADARTVNVGSGGVEADMSTSGRAGETLRSPATATDAAAAPVGRESKDALGGLPNDAVTRDKKDHASTVDTTQK